MLLLFLDTETSALTPTKGQVIEIGGILANLDKLTFKLTEISSFESLVFLREEKLEEKITRLTGITNLELQTAPDLNKVQETWLSWLEPYISDIKGIVGHSIDFDLNFLKAEKWFLPENAKNIDTLNLARVFYPEFQAINLEYLSKKLELLDKNKTQSHRSLSDTRFDLNLFQKILEKINSLSLNQFFLEKFQADFLPLNLTFQADYKTHKSSKNFKNKLKDTEKEKIIKINLFKRPVSQDYWQRYNQILEILGTKDFQFLDSFNFKNELKIAFYQIQVASFIKQKNPDLDLKFHLSGDKKSLYWFNLLLSSLEKEKGILQKAEISLADKEIILKKPEEILSKVGLLAKNNFNLGKIITLLEFLQASYEDIQNPEILNFFKNLQKKEINKKIQTTINAYDFFLLNLQPFLQNGKFTINPYKKDYKELESQNRFFKFLQELKLLTKDLENLERPKNQLLEILLQEINYSISDLEIDFNLYYEISLSGQDLYLSHNKKNFVLSNYFEEIILKPISVKLESDLDLDNLTDLMILAGLDKILEKREDLEIEFEKLHRVEKVDKMNLLDFYDCNIKKSLLENKPILVLAGLNSSLKDSQRVLTKNFDTKNYLILGESGSQTKIFSKLTNGFKGIVVLKVASFQSLQNYFNKLDFLEIWFLNQPYFWIADFWKNKSRQSNNPDLFIEKLKSLHLIWQFQTVSRYYPEKVKYLKGYDI
jgi:DNA polymerase III epsilon subunit-like protein